MKKMFHTVCVLFLLSHVGLSTSVGESVRVKADNVNLRAAPTNTAEVLSQAATGQILTASGTQTDDWLGVVPPDATDFWVYDEFVVEGVVAVSKLQVRAGPGINYTVLGKLEKGAVVDPRGREGEWQKIAPPSGCILWISRDYVDAVVPVSNVNVVTGSVASVADAPKSVSIEKPPLPAQLLADVVPVGDDKNVIMTPPTAGLDASKLEHDVQQGLVVERNGVVKAAGIVWGAPGRYRLVSYDKWDRAVTICYLHGNDDYWASLHNKSVSVRGRQYWQKGVRYPILVPEQFSFRR